MSALFSEGHLGSLKLANRIAVSPMCQYVALVRGMLYDARWPWHAAAQWAPRYQHRHPTGVHRRTSTRDYSKVSNSARAELAQAQPAFGAMPP
jgi:hypothetical protein